MFFEQQISMLVWFLKDHVTLKTGVMAAENKNNSYIKISVLLYFTTLKLLNISV